VITPSLIPRAPATGPETDRRNGRRLARLPRAGELVAIRIPTVAEEAVRDLCRARADLVQDRTRARHRLEPSSCCAAAGPGGAETPGADP
jgi:transposase